MREGIVLVILVCFGIADIRKRSLSLPMLAAALGAALLFRLLWDFGLVAAGIGIGDGLLLAVTGILLGFWENMELFLTGLFFCALFSAVVLVIFRKGRGYRVPFVPFLAGAQLFRILVLL